MNNSMIVSLIGRPNVGKSSIFNILMSGEKKALTFDSPGVTRDRHYGVVNLTEEIGSKKNIEFLLVDTGGFYPKKIEVSEVPKSKNNEVGSQFFNIMADQAKIAIEESDLVLFVVDVREGILPFDSEIAEYIRTRKKPFWVLVNKYDTDGQRGDEGEFYSLGIESNDLFLISAEHRRGVGDLKDRLAQANLDFQKNSSIKKSAELAIKPQSDVFGNISIIGAPNSGKSTLLNQLIGAKRALVSDIPGTTVDPIEGHFEIDFGKSVLSEEELNQDSENTPNTFRSLKIIDTAGIRKQKLIKGFVEAQSVFRALRCITDSDVVIFMIDAEKGIAHQDRRLMDITLEKGKSLIICLNKIDLLSDIFKDNKTRKLWLDDLKYKIPWLEYCDLIPISAKENKHISNLISSIKKTILVRNKTIPTGQLNRCVSEMCERHNIVLKGAQRGSVFKVKYASMVKTSPPTFLFFVNRSKGIPDSYKRYMQKSLRDKFNLVNTPIHILFRTGEENKKPKIVGHKPKVTPRNLRR